MRTVETSSQVNLQKATDTAELRFAGKDGWIAPSQIFRRQLTYTLA
jgi:hypothetical protein